MLAFTKEEFDIMIDQLLNRQKPVYDMLCVIAEKTLRKQVVQWCRSDITVGGKNCGIEDDAMQDIHVRLIKTVIPRFLLKNGPDGEINYDPEGFNRWMFTVAKRITIGNLDKVKKKSTASLYNSEGKPVDVAVEAEFDNGEQEEQREKLNKCFGIVFSSDTRAYKAICWITLSLLILNLNATKIESTAVLVDTVGSKTLDELWQIACKLAKKLDWLVITEEQKKKIEEKLSKRFDSSRTWGEVTFKECYMKKGDKESVSDWSNRINDMIKRGFEDETSDD